MRHRLLFLLATAAILVGSATSSAQGPRQPTRSELDSEAARATRLDDMLQVADRYAGSGYQHEAKAIVDRAARQARSPADWQSIAAMYLRLGFTDQANAAQRRSRESSR